MTNEELTIHLTTLASQTSAQSETLARIEEKVTATNGRVRAIELWQARLKGAWALALVVGPIVGVVVGPHLGL